jgi:hypothetical protein
MDHLASKKTSIALSIKFQLKVLKNHVCTVLKLLQNIVCVFLSAIPGQTTYNYRLQRALILNQ